VLTEVVVPAQFGEETLQETPTVIRVITADLLEARSQTRTRPITRASTAP